MASMLLLRCTTAVERGMAFSFSETYLMRLPRASAPWAILSPQVRHLGAEISRAAHSYEGCCGVLMPVWAVYGCTFAGEAAHHER